MATSNAGTTSCVVYTAEPLPFPVDALVQYGFSSAAVRGHCAYEQQCAKQLNALVYQQRASLNMPRGTHDLLSLLRHAPAQSEVAQLAAELLSHNYYWSSLRQTPTVPRRERYLRATLTKPARDVSSAQVTVPGDAPRQGSAFSEAVRVAFGSVQSLRQQMLVLARTLHGSGWVWFVWDFASERLQLLLESGACCPLAVPLKSEATGVSLSATPALMPVSAPVTASPAPVVTEGQGVSARLPSFTAVRAAASAQASKVRVWSRGVTALTQRAVSRKKMHPVSSDNAAKAELVATPSPPANAVSTGATTPNETASGVKPAAPAPIKPVVPRTAAWRPRYAALFACDLWEHAYLRDFGVQRDTYVASFWGALDWRVVEARFEAALRSDKAGSPLQSKL